MNYPLSYLFHRVMSISIVDDDFVIRKKESTMKVYNWTYYGGAVCGYNM